MKFFGIEKPATKRDKAIIAWLGTSQSDAWNKFFLENPHRFPLFEAQKAYEAIGYRCVELECWVERYLPTMSELYPDNMYEEATETGG